MTVRVKPTQDYCVKPQPQGTDADACLGQRKTMLRVARRIKADAFQVTMPQGFRDRVWQKIAAGSRGSLPHRPAVNLHGPANYGLQAVMKRDGRRLSM